MSKESTLLIIGVLVLVSPYLGLPMPWLTILLVILGAGTIAISQIMRRGRSTTHTPIEPAQPTEPAPRPLSF